jgi:hypothetical protein
MANVERQDATGTGHETDDHAHPGTMTYVVVGIILAVLTGQPVWFVGAGEHAAFVGAAGYVVGDIDRFWVSGLYRAINYRTRFILEHFDGSSSLTSVFFRCCLL